MHTFIIFTDKTTYLRGTRCRITTRRHELRANSLAEACSAAQLAHPGSAVAMCWPVWN